MSDDLTEAIEATLTGIDPDYHLSAFERDGIASAIRAAAPIIREQAKAEERERIAAAIEAEKVEARRTGVNVSPVAAYAKSARIARGGA